MSKKVIIFGGTGMVGGKVTELALAHPDISQVLCFLRKSTERTSEKLVEIFPSDFKDYSSYTKELSGVDAVYFCLGAYTGTLDKKSFHEVNVAIPNAFAEALCQHSPNAAFCLLSGAGADRSEKSSIQFAREKGIIENKLSRLSLGRLHCFRPGYIYPVEPRKEPNFSYRLMRWLYPVLLKPLGKNYSITSHQLAQAIFHAGLNDPGMEVLENGEILDL